MYVMSISTQGNLAQRKGDEVALRSVVMRATPISPHLHALARVWRDQRRMLAAGLASGTPDYFQVKYSSHSVESAAIEQVTVELSQRTQQFDFEALEHDRFREPHSTT